MNRTNRFHYRPIPLVLPAQFCLRAMPALWKRDSTYGLLKRRSVPLRAVMTRESAVDVLGSFARHKLVGLEMLYFDALLGF